MGTKSKIILISALVAGFALVGPSNSPGPDTAWAMNGVAKNSIGLKQFKKSLRKMFKEMKKRTNMTSFAGSLNSDGRINLITQGSLRLFANCEFNKDFGSGPDDRIQLFVTGTTNGWFAGDGQPARAANDEVQVGEWRVPAGTSSYQINAFGNLFGAVAPDGAKIGPHVELGIGFNLFEPGCRVTGNAPAFKYNS